MSDVWMAAGWLALVLSWTFWLFRGVSWWASMALRQGGRLFHVGVYIGKKNFNFFFRFRLKTVLLFFCFFLEGAAPIWAPRLDGHLWSNQLSNSSIDTWGQHLSANISPLPTFRNLRHTSHRQRTTLWKQTLVTGIVVFPLDLVITTLALSETLADDKFSESAKMPETVAEEKQNEGPAEAPKEWRNIVLSGFGGLKMVKVQKKPEPKPGEGEVLIRVKACGLNFVDLMVRQGVLEQHPPKTPLTIGFECSGDVEAVGENTEGIAVNDRVIAFTDYGAWSEVVTVPAKFVYKMPSNMSYQDGAALPMNFLTAYIMLFDIGNLQKGMSVFSHNIGGGVGHAIGQLCKTVEDVTLYGTASAHKHEAVKGNVTNVFNRTSDYCQEVRKLSPAGVDIVLDCLCGEDTNKGISLLRPMGKYILYGSSNIVTGETKSFFSFAKSHFIDGKPTTANPDPEPASRYEKVTPARRPPKPRAHSEPPKKKIRTALSETFSHSHNQNVVIVHPTVSAFMSEQEDAFHGDCTNSNAQNNEGNPLEMLALAAENETIKKHLAGLILQNTELKRKVANAEQKSKELREDNKKPKLMSAAKIRENVKKDEFVYYTGLTAKQFKAFYNFLVPQENPFKMSKRIKSAENLTMEDQLLLVMMKLRQNFDFAHLGNLFGMTQQDASSLFKNWIQYMFHRCGSVSIWPHRDIIISEMPPTFREEFPNTLVIIDGTEIKIQRPSSMTRQSQCYSDYKSCNTLKGLVGIDPRGSIIFASMLFSGAISDKEITRQSGFLSLLQEFKECGKINDGDGVMVDKGFHISEEIEKLGLKLNIPPFARSGSQMSKADIKLTEKIARHRVHVERAISRVKNYKILSQRIDLALFTCINQIWFVCCFVTNFMGYLIKKK